MKLETEKDYQNYLTEHDLSADSYNDMERMVVAVAREIPDKSIAFVGTGMPIIAANLAKRIHSPDIYLILEAGTVDPQMEHTPNSVGDPRASYKASLLGSLADSFGAASRGYCSIGILGCAECDKYANLNSTCIGGYYSGVGSKCDSSYKRLGGCGGATDIAAYADKMIINTKHELRRFPEKVSYLSTVAGMRGPNGESRFNVGLYRGGNVVVITDLCIMKPDENSGVLYVSDVFSGVKEEEIIRQTGWNIDMSRAQSCPEPTYDELKQLRLFVDPKRLYLGKTNNNKKESK